MSLAAIVGAVVGALIALVHSGPSAGIMFWVELEFIATGFAFLGAMFALIGASEEEGLHG